jgi:hypothetical protein
MIPTQGRSAKTITVAIAMVVMVAGCKDGSAPFAPTPGRFDEQSFARRTSTGELIRVSGINGSIVAESVGGDIVGVDVTKTGDEDDPDEVEIEIVEFSGGITFCATYPTEGGGRTGCEASGAVGEGTLTSDVIVDFAVRVPAGSTFDGLTINGSVTARDMLGDVHGGTINGGVDVGSVHGLVEADAVNGPVTAAIGAPSWPGALNVTAVNGPISVFLPDDVEANLVVTIANGEFTSDFPIINRAGRIPGILTGRIGAGGGALQVTTINGDIDLRLYPE